MRAVSGNAAGSLKLLGPTIRTFDPPKVVPPATCGPFGEDEGQISFTMNVAASIPADFVNQAVVAFVEVINNKGHESGVGKFCVTQVIP